jgi:uncharacterized protein
MLSRSHPILSSPLVSNMTSKSPARWLTASALALGLLTTGTATLVTLGTTSVAQAQSSTAAAEPTLAQVYEAAQAGKFDQAQVMMQQVLVAHPNSAKAHFVQAELSARQGHLARARESLATAEKIAPGLGFAKADAVQALRTQLNATGNGNTGTAVTTRPDARSEVRADSSMGKAAPAAPASSFPWGLALALGGGAIGLAIYLKGKKSNATAPVNPGFNMNPNGNPNGNGQNLGIGSGLGGPQTFGNGQPPAGQPPYGQPGYGQPGYGQQAPGMGMGGRVMGGLATGLAVGAGVMAAQAIGKSMMGGDEHGSRNNQSNADNGGGANNGFEPLNNNGGNANFGGQNFGVADAGSWDDGGGMGAVASSGGDGGDWDS